MQKKVTKEGKILRNTRKNCIKKIGKEKFNFDAEEEFIKYKYVCCAKMERKEWKKCKKYDTSYSYSEWEGKIKEKYSMYSKFQLEEFSKHLELGIRDNNTSREINSIVFAALLSSVLAVIFGNLVLPKIQELKTVWEFLIFLISILLVITPELVFVIYSVYIPMQNNNLEQEMYSDYKEVIDMLINEKK